MNVGCEDTGFSTDFGGIPRNVTVYEVQRWWKTLTLSRTGPKTRNGHLGSHQSEIVCRILFSLILFDLAIACCQNNVVRSAVLQ